MWGVATSAHQVEGGNHNDWSEWEKSPERIADLNRRSLNPEEYISGVACDHYHRFQEDFDIAKSLGHTAHRFSIEWSRIEPEKGEFNEKEIAHYRDVIYALRERGIEPFVTLWHWTIPLWLQNEGGVLSKKFPHFFVRYAEKIGRAFKDDVRFWITVNEPEIYALNSYLRGIWPPQRKSIFLFYKAIFRLVQAHTLGFQALKKIHPDFQMGASLNLSYFESAGGIVNAILTWGADRIWNFHFLHHIKHNLDFIGLNYYFHNRVNYGFNKNENKIVSDMGWELYPEGIYHVLDDLKKFKKPVYITENGLADAKDDKRELFIRETLKFVDHAMKEGVDVRGYFHWSLLDNFEWDKGFWPRFGLIEVDYKTQKRHIRQSAFVYKKFIESGV